MTKEQLVEFIAEKGKIGKKEAAAALAVVFEVLQEAMVAGESVTIKGFGTFGSVDRAARKAKNPQTGAEIQVAARRVPSFKAGKGLKDAVAVRK